jgi:putative peptidoglycan lipid II flippase
MGPAIIGVSVSQINLLVDTMFASFLQVGSVSWLYFSDRLLQFPMGIFGVAISTVVLPSLSHHVAGKDHQQYSKTLDWGLRLLFLVGMPATVGLFILAGPLFSALLQYKAFGPHDVLMSRESLMAFSLGLQAFMLAKVLASGFYAHQDIKTPVKIAIVCMATNVILNASFIHVLHHAGIALATSLSGILNALLLWRGLQKKKVYQPGNGWFKYGTQLLLANLAMGLFLWGADEHLTVWMQHGAIWRLSHLGFLVIGGVAIYFIVLYATGLRFKTFMIKN